MISKAMISKATHNIVVSRTSTTIFLFYKFCLSAKRSFADNFIPKKDFGNKKNVFAEKENNSQDARFTIFSEFSVSLWQKCSLLL